MIILGRCYDYSGTVLRLFWDGVMIILGRCYDYSGTVLDYSGTVL